MTDPEQFAPGPYRFSGRTAAELSRSIERGILRGHLRPGDVLPSIRSLAGELGVSPTTVSSAYRDLRQRGVLISHDRSRTVVAHRPPLGYRLGTTVPPGATDLATGNPDPRLLPNLGAHLAQLGPTHRLYGESAAVPDLLDIARHDARDDDIPTEQLNVVGGGLDGIERVLEVHCRVGDRIAVEDPCYIGSLDLIRTLGLVPVPVGVDDQGPDPEQLGQALEQDLSAVLLVPRAQNPTGAALSPTRAAELRALLADHPEVVVIEDDHLGQVSGAAYHGVAPHRDRWAVVRSVAKWLGPDLRVALLASDPETAAHLLGRQRLGTGWVSHLLQQLTAVTWRASIEDGTLDRATSTYRERRQAARRALAEVGIVSWGATGLNLWVPVAEEVPVVQGLGARGWAVQAGEPFRLTSEPAVRITVAGLPAERAGLLAADLAELLGSQLDTRRG